MDISQADRDKLRASQHQLNPEAIGTIIEHKPQNPKKYKDLSKNDNLGDKASLPQLPKIKYESRYLNSKPPTPLSKDIQDALPEEVNLLHKNPWLNMDQVEFDKLEWMGNNVDRIHKERLHRTTQFDKEGQAIPSNQIDDIANKSNETHDIESLVNLLDSAYDPQVGYALNVISKIANLAHLGYYDGSFDENIHEILLKNCLLRVRHQLDHTNETICQSAIKCLRSLLCNTQVDEIVLDRTFPIFSQHPNSNLWLHTIEMDAQNFTMEMKDIECVEVDTILAVIFRTNLLERFTYLLEVKNGEFAYVYQDCILDILIRIARHSPAVSKSLISKKLFGLIIKMFLPAYVANESEQMQQLAIKSLKLTRIIVQAYFELQLLSRKDSSIKVMDLKILDNIFPSLEAYFFIDCLQLPKDQSDSLMKLHIETLRILKLMCRAKKFQNRVISIATMATEELNPRFKALNMLNSEVEFGSKISLDWQYAAHLIDFAGYTMGQEKFHKVCNAKSMGRLWDAWVKPITLKWLTHIVKAKNIPHLDVSITIASALFHFRSTACKSDADRLSYILVESITNNVDLSGKPERGLNLFKILARSAAENSHLPRVFKDSGRLRDPKGLPSYGCLNYNTSSQYVFKLVPLFEANSPFILLQSYLLELQQPKVKIQKNLAYFADCLELNRYIRLITDQVDYPKSYESKVQQSIAAQYEIEVITYSLLLLNDYYLSYSEDVELEEVSEVEPLGLEKNRVECYGNICYYTILLVGLLVPNSNHLLLLKDQLFEKILFDSKFQTRIAREESKKHKIPNAIPKHFIIGPELARDLANSYLNVLGPIYLSCEQYDRFWIFQPFIEYYWHHFKEVDESQNEKEKEKEKDDRGRWYYSNIQWRIHTGEIVSADDSTVVNIILAFNGAMMQCSPSYLHLLIQPNMEDYLCVLGTLFLDDNVFHDRDVSRSISFNLTTMISSALFKTNHLAIFKDACKVIEPLELTLGDFFNKIVDQYEAASYGDVAFTNFLLLFINPNSDKIFRKKLFQEKVETCLSQIRICSEELWCSKYVFLGPKEKDLEMIEILNRAGAHLKRGSFVDEYRIFHTGK